MNKRNKIKAGVSFGIAYAILSILVNLLTHDNPATKDIITFVISALLGAP